MCGNSLAPDRADLLLDPLLIAEHATDTHGATLANFALFDLVGLQLSPRIRDLGKITLYRTGPRAVYAARYLADETYRRRIARQLNKGENLHALKRSLAYAGQGALRRRHHEQQAEQMWCLTLATNAVVTWTTEYHGLAVAALRRAGRHIDDAVLAHIWPTHHENVHFYGTHSVDVDGELAKLDADGYRPLRVIAATEQAR